MGNIQYQPSIRANVLTRRTYNRPLNDEGTIFETWRQTVDRTIEHQRWLWERALGDSLVKEQKAELAELSELMLNRFVAPAGRSLWLGGTDVSRTKEICAFNCTALNIRTIHDLVDLTHCLLNGCGVGFKPVSGSLSGFTRRVDVQIVRSKRGALEKGRPTNTETFDPLTKTWTIGIGDSSEGWAKAIGKLLAGKFPAKKLVIDLSELRGPGARLKKYGWISSGDNSISIALAAISAIMNRQAGKLLSKIDILDICNWIGTILSSRRSAEIALVDYGSSEWQDFALAKSPKMLEKHWHRSQSNNSLMFNEKPTIKQLNDLFDIIVANAGSEPGLINSVALKERAPYAELLNPCGEILLPHAGVCNLCELDLGKFKGDHLGMHKAMKLIARANYRQTQVNLNDSILQSTWHQNNEFLRLCGCSLSGVVRRPDFTPYDYRQLRNTAIASAYAMADELNSERPKNVTTIKPSGTIAKCYDTSEGVHKPMSKYIINNVVFSKHDLLVNKLADANYTIMDHPFDKEAVLISLPVSYDDIQFDSFKGMDINKESAITQLNRYKMMQQNYVDQNTSITVSYDPSEVKSIVKWLDANWDDYVAISMLFRNDPTKTAKDLGYSYLPQVAVNKETYDEYVAKLKDVDIDNVGSIDTPLDDKECAGGVCPTR